MNGFDLNHDLICKSVFDVRFTILI